MKNLERISIVLITLLSILIVFLIVKYNMIGDEAIEKIVYQISENDISDKEDTNDYLQDIEGYIDVDVDVDAREEGSINRVTIKSEELKDKSNFSSIISNPKEVVSQKEDRLQELEGEETFDDIGLAIDAVLDN